MAAIPKPFAKISMSEAKLCKRCGRPVVVNLAYCDDLYEGMHWLCFHLEFEHVDVDPDEPCTDPGCYWKLTK